MTPIEWLICAVACLGFAFDTYELLVLSLIVRPALTEFLAVPAGSPEFNRWVGMLFYIPAVAGGIFGLMGGYLSDRLGRRRVLLWSILLYGCSAFATGFADSAVELLILRCTTFIGVSVEFVAATAWLAEVFSEREQREAVLGYTQMFSSTGGILVSGAYYLAVTYSHMLPEIRGGHEAWRYTVMAGLLPAIPLMLVRPFLPESPVWQRKKAAGTLKRPSLREIFRPRFRRTSLVTCLMMACAYAASFGMLRRTEVARLLISNPTLLLLDEAFSGLDHEAQELIDALLARTVEGDGAAVIVSHDSGHLAERAHHVLLLHGGRLQAPA